MVELSPVAEDILRERYYLYGENWRTLCKRVARAVAKAEPTAERSAWERRFFNIMYNLDFLPNSPTLMNAGTSLGQLSACFVLDIEDSMESIFQTLKEMALIQKSGGGTGFNFSKLRPAGAPVRSTNGVASGVVSFMKVYNAATDVIKQGGKRRGANIGILDYSHPEIRDFVTAKDGTGELQNFNISVMITDDEMEDRDEEDIFEKIVYQAWKNGEPGLLFYDSINGDNVLPDYGEIKATNPCIAEGSLVLTPKGLVRIEDWERSWFTGVKRCVRLILSNGMSLTCTPEHQVMTIDGFKPASECLGENVITPSEPISIPERTDVWEGFVLYGFLYGDGYHAGGGHGISVSLDSEKEPDIAKLLKRYGFHQQNCGKFYINRKKLPFSITIPNTHKKTIPQEILTGSPENLAAFLCGLYTANGCVTANGKRISYKTTSKRLAKEIQIALSLFGIHSYITVNKKRRVTFTNGDYTCAESYDVNIASQDSREKFFRFIGFYDNRKNSAHCPTRKGRKNYPEVVRIEDAGYRKVYDFKMTDEQPWAFCNGVAVHNCSEVPMFPYESCNLGSINLAQMVDDNGDFDYDKYKYVIEVAVRFLDNVITVNKFPLPQIGYTTQQTRRIGLGVMGFHDMLLCMGVRYSSKKALGIIDYVAGVLNDVAVWASEGLAEERGVFPLWKGSLWETDFNIRVRNCTVTSIAPTGTLSRIAGVSSGIEPNFAYTQEFNILGRKFTWVHPLKDSIDEKLLETSHDISPMHHLRVLAAWQENIQNGVSKTVNLPHNATVDEVEKIFVRAWEWKCKGITVYRDGSREGQPVRKCEDAESCTL